MFYSVTSTFSSSLLVTWESKPEKMPRTIITVKMPLSSLYLLQILTGRLLLKKIVFTLITVLRFQLLHYTNHKLPFPWIILDTFLNYRIFLFITLMMYLLSFLHQPWVIKCCWLMLKVLCVIFTKICKIYRKIAVTY